MPIAAGSEQYKLSFPPVEIRGMSFSDAEIDQALANEVGRILWDDAGRAEVGRILAELATTDFAQDKLREALDHEPSVEEWRVGEAFAEAYLVEHCKCEFPWPAGRDLRNHDASPAGTDLVGFQDTRDGVRFAFGEVKTSYQQRWPPNVLFGRSGLTKQLENLRDQQLVKDQLVVYLCHRAKGASWCARYKAAATRYFADPTDVALFGVLVRDVPPKLADLAGRGRSLAEGCPDRTSIELYAMYFPDGTIVNLPVRAVRLRKEGRR